MVSLNSYRRETEQRKKTHEHGMDINAELAADCSLGNSISEWRGAIGNSTDCWSQYMFVIDCTISI